MLVPFQKYSNIIKDRPEFGRTVFAKHIKKKKNFLQTIEKNFDYPICLTIIQEKHLI